jgi:hypothetical protein
VCKKARKREKERKNREKIKFLLFFLKKINSRQRIKIKNKKKCPVSRAQGWGALLPC